MQKADQGKTALHIHPIFILKEGDFLIRVLVLGGSGLVGRTLISQINQYPKYQIFATYYENQCLSTNVQYIKLDIKDSEYIKRILDAVKPQIVISCLRGDFDKQLILHVVVAEYLKRENGMLYYFSTTNVFDNNFSKPHYEDDETNSQTDYGQYKMECESRMAAILHDQVCILRIPQVWGEFSPRMKELQNSVQTKKEITVYPELFINTNTDIVIAKQLCYIIENDLHGIFHLAAEDMIGYKELYVHLIEGLCLCAPVLKEDISEKGYFVILSKRSREFPTQLRITNQMVIDYLIDNIRKISKPGISTVMQ